MNVNSANPTQTNSGCPIKMSDGRQFTDYRPRCAINANLMTDLDKNNIIKSSYDSRMYLQQNAEKIMEENKLHAQNNLMPCAPCNRPENLSGTMYPERYVVKCNPTYCEKIEVNKYGLGTSTRVHV